MIPTVRAEYLFIKPNQIMINFIQGIKTLSPPPSPIFLLAFGLLIAGCNDSAVTEIEFANQQSLDTPEAYLKAIAKAQTN